MSTKGQERSFIFGNKKPSKFVEVIYKVIVTIIWGFLYTTLFGFIIGLISGYNNEILNSFLNSLIPFSFILAVITMEKIFKDNFDRSFKIKNKDYFNKSIILVVFIYVLIYITFLLVNKPSKYILNSDIGLKLFVSIFSNIIYGICSIYLFIGYIYNLIKSRYGYKKGIFFTSLIYTILFIINRGESSLFIPMFIFFLKMFLFILLYEFSNSLITSMVTISIYSILHMNILSLSYMEILNSEFLLATLDDSNNLLAYEYGADSLLISLLLFLIIDIFLYIKFRKNEKNIIEEKKVEYGK